MQTCCQNCSDCSKNKHRSEEDKKNLIKRLNRVEGQIRGINKMVEEGFYYTAGKIRNVPVSIGGTTWKPDLPIESIVKEEIDEILNKEIEDVEKAIELLLYTMKKQIFIDGNKRTSVIYANHYLISKGKGIIVIPAELTEEFKNLLIPYYEGKDEIEIKTFIKEKCYMSI